VWISRTLRQPLDFRQFFKLRLVVAAMGETQRLGWWNSGVLTGVELVEEKSITLRWTSHTNRQAQPLYLRCNKCRSARSCVPTPP